jgi:hypothetical protein
MSGILLLQSSHSMCGVLLWIKGFGFGYRYGYDYIISMIIVFTYFDIDMGQRSALFVLVLIYRCKHSIWLNLKWIK